MPDAEPLPAPPAVPTARDEILVVAGFSVAIMLCFGYEIWTSMSKPVGSRPPMFLCLGGILLMLGNATWITLDRKRSGKDVGWWRFAALAWGPLAILAYIVLQRRERAKVLIPGLIFVYLLIWNFPGIAVALLRQDWR